MSPGRESASGFQRGNSDAGTGDGQKGAERIAAIVNTGCTWCVIAGLVSLLGLPEHSESESSFMALGNKRRDGVVRVPYLEGQ